MYEHVCRTSITELVPLARCIIIHRSRAVVETNRQITCLPFVRRRSSPAFNRLHPLDYEESPLWQQTNGSPWYLLVHIESAPWIPVSSLSLSMLRSEPSELPLMQRCGTQRSAEYRWRTRLGNENPAIRLASEQDGEGVCERVPGEEEKRRGRRQTDGRTEGGEGYEYSYAVVNPGRRLGASPTRAG